MTGPTVRSGAALDLTIRADRPVVNAQVVPGPAGPPGAPAFGIMASGTVSTPVNTSGATFLFVPFPPGRFTQPPTVVATTYDPAGPSSNGVQTPHVAVHVQQATTSGFQLSVQYNTAYTLTGTIHVNWFAVQTTGPGQPPAGYPILATNLATRPNPSAANPWTAVGAATILNMNDPEVGDFARVSVANITATSGANIPGVIPFAAGARYVFSGFYRNNGSTPLVVRQSFSSTTANTPGTNPITVPPDGQWHRFWWAFTNNAGVAPTARPVEFLTTAGWTQTGTVDVARVNITEGPALLDYFDGNTPGGRWTGAVGNSTSELLGPRMGDISGIVAAETADLRAVELRGVGSPQNSVAAPVGTYYTDTAATNGAIRWIKQTGTGNTGWRVLWGDTSNRVITGLLINGWAASNVTIRRWGDLVTVWVNGLNPAAATDDALMLDLGLGWRQFSNARAALTLLSGANPPQVGRLIPGNSAQPWTLARAGLVQGLYQGCFSWQCAEAWPDTLPGT